MPIEDISFLLIKAIIAIVNNFMRKPRYHKLRYRKCSKYFLGTVLPV